MSPPESNRLLYPPEAIARRVGELGAAIARDYAGRDLVLVGVLKGAAYFLTDLSRAIDLPHRIDFVAAASYGEQTESCGTVTVTRDVTLDIEGCDVLLVDDIYDSGRTLAVLVERVRAHRPTSVHLCSLLVKETARTADLPIRYHGFRVADEFVVGYGLDLAERHRHLPGLYVVGEAP